MIELTFIRHGKPVETKEHHSKWDITEEHKEKASKLGFAAWDFDMNFASKYLRAERTRDYCLLPYFGKKRPDIEDRYNKNMINLHTSCLFNEIHKPDETPELLDKRVKESIVMLRLNRWFHFKDQEIVKIFVACHNRYMIHAYKQLKGKDKGGFDYLEYFTHEIDDNYKEVREGMD
jgi:hypothetical protein